MKRKPAKAIANAPYASGSSHRARSTFTPKPTAAVSPWSKTDNAERIPQTRKRSAVIRMPVAGGSISCARLSAAASVTGGSAERRAQLIEPQAPVLDVIEVHCHVGL